MEQQAIFNANNFSLCPMDLGPGYASMVTAATSQIGALFCPSESASTQRCHPAAGAHYISRGA
jgi:hypothetical protein